MPAKKRISVDKVEYDALCDLRDGEHVRLQLRLIDKDENYKSCLKINEAQCARLVSQDLLLTSLHGKIDALEREVARLEADRGAADRATALEKRVKELEAEVEHWRPAQSSVQQPAFGRRP